MGNPNYDNCILGAGIAGLITFYYLAETTHTRNLLITKSFESQTNTKFQLGPRFLRYNKDTETLLKKLGLPIITREVFVGAETKESQRIYTGDQDSNNFTVFTTSQIALSKLLLEKCLQISKDSQKNHVIIDEVKSINHKKITTKKDSYYTNHIISTIPLSSLTNILSNSSMAIRITAKKMDIYFFLVNEENKSQFDYVYNMINNAWYRKTYLPELKKWVYETNKPEAFLSIYGEWITEKGIKISYDQNTNFNIKDLGEHIKLVGRYSQMNENIKTEDIIHWAYNYTRKFKKKD